MDTSIIIIIVLSILLVALGFAAFVPIKGKKLLCSASKKCPPATKCPKVKKCSTSSADADADTATATDCKVQIAEAMKDCNKNPAAFYDKAWCKSTYSDIQTETAYCTGVKKSISDYIEKLKTKSSTVQYLIKRKAGATVEYYTDAGVQPAITTVDAIEAFSVPTRKMEPSAVLGYLTVADSPPFIKTDDFMTDIGLAMGLFDKTKKITGGAIQTVATPATTSVSSVTKIDSLWSLIGEGNIYTYYYLKIDKDAMVTALTASKTAFGMYCL
jgi:hypothetical protein